MQVLDTLTLRTMDQRAVKEYGIPGILLMENAARAVLRHMDLSGKYFVIVCGTGNNGGDGFALAWMLQSLGKEVDVFLVSEGREPEGDAGVFFRILQNTGGSLEILSDQDHLWSFVEALKDADEVVDALLGTGMTRELPELHQRIIDYMNDFSPKVISIDVPSGLSADEGKPMPVAVHAGKTVTFEGYKKGFLSYEALPYLGEVLVESVGIPMKLKEELGGSVFLTDLPAALRILPERRITGHKSHYGRVLVVAGSRGFTGAAMLCAEASLATGAGLVTLCSFSDTLEILVPRLTEIMSLHEDGLEEGAEKADVVAFGPGLGSTEGTFQLLLRVIKTLQEEGKSDSTLVIDADGLNVLEGRCEILSPVCFQVILTPHPGEMSRLTGLSKEAIEADRTSAARDLARKYGIIVVLKGYHTVVTDGETVHVNSTGSSAMAQGGMGDVLTGIIASLAGQGMKPLEAAVLGTYLHGFIGDGLAKRRYSVKASEIIESIPFHMKRLQMESRNLR